LVFDNSGIRVFFFSDNSLILACKTKTIVPFLFSLSIIGLPCKGTGTKAGVADWTY
jgi:hypothetical protein